MLTQLYGAREASDSKASYKSRKFELPDGTKIGVTDDLWHDNTNNVGKKGAINLVMHLSGYGQEQYKQALHDLRTASRSHGNAPLWFAREHGTRLPIGDALTI